MFALSRRSYKVYASFGLNPKLLVRQLSVLDTGAGPNFIRADVLPKGYSSLLAKGPMPSVADANGRPLSMSGIITLWVRLGSYLKRVPFFVCTRLAAPVILGCDFNDKHVDAILPRQKAVRLVDGSEVPIVRKPQARLPSSPPLPEEQEYAADARHVSPKLKTVEQVEIPPGAQRWVRVVSQRNGLSVLEPNTSLYERHRIAMSNGVADIKANVAFRVLVANFSLVKKRIVRNQVIGKVLPHPHAMVATCLPLRPALGG